MQESDMNEALRSAISEFLAMLFKIQIAEDMQVTEILHEALPRDGSIPERIKKMASDEESMRKLYKVLEEHAQQAHPTPQQMFKGAESVVYIAHIDNAHFYNGKMPDMEEHRNAS